MHIYVSKMSNLYHHLNTLLFLLLHLYISFSSHTSKTYRDILFLLFLFFVTLLFSRLTFLQGKIQGKEIVKVAHEYMLNHMLISFWCIATSEHRRSSYVVTSHSGCGFKWPRTHKHTLSLSESSRSQTRASSQFAGVVTACSLCVCRAVPISQTPFCTPWVRTALVSGEFTHLHTTFFHLVWKWILRRYCFTSDHFHLTIFKLISRMYSDSLDPSRLMLCLDFSEMVET